MHRDSRDDLFDGAFRNELFALRFLEGFHCHQITDCSIGFNSKDILFRSDVFRHGRSPAQDVKDIRVFGYVVQDRDVIAGSGRVIGRKREVDDRFMQLTLFDDL